MQSHRSATAEHTSSIDVDRLEYTIQQLPAVYAARVFLEPNARVVEKIHVMAAPGRSPKKVVRDIESLLLLQFGVRLDYRRISLIQLRPEDATPFLRPRLKLLSIESSGDGQQGVTVRLAGEGQTHTGSAEGSDGPETIAARAVLAAIADVLGEATVTVDAVERVTIGGDVALLVAITAVASGRQEKLLGACFVQQDPLAAAVRATLDALNRRFFTTPLAKERPPRSQESPE